MVDKLVDKEYVLLVEDSEPDINLFLNVIEMQDFSGEVKIIRYGREVIEYLTYHKDHLPRTIIMDIGLPDMPGLELLRHLKKQPIICDIPIIIWSGSESPRTKEESEQLGAIYYLHKPADLYEYEKQMKWFLTCWDKIA